MIKVGFDLEITGPSRNHFQVVPKYSHTERALNHSYNWVNAKVRANSRFVALSVQGNQTVVSIGYHYDYSGSSIYKDITLENSDGTLRCFDIDEVFDKTGRAYAIVDCGVFSANNKLKYNEFYYVDLVMY